jgi:hypothetical protein
MLQCCKFEGLALELCVSCYTLGTSEHHEFFLWINLLKYTADTSHSSGVKVKNACSHNSTAPYTFMVKTRTILLILTLTYLFTAIGLTHGGSSTVHIYTQTIHRTIQFITLVGRLSGIRTQSGQTKINDELTAWKKSPNWEECRWCPIFASYILAFALQLRKKRGENLSQGSRRVPVGTVLLSSWKQFLRSNETPTWYNTVQVLFLQGHSTCFGAQAPIIRSI